MPLSSIIGLLPADPIRKLSTKLKILQNVLKFSEENWSKASHFSVHNRIIEKMY